jgi:transposase
MNQVVAIGLDIAKSVFQVHGVDADGAVVLRRRLTRSRMLSFSAKQAPCLIGLEACGSAPYLGREIQPPARTGCYGGVWGFRSAADG